MAKKKSEKRLKESFQILVTDSNYLQFLHDIKDKIRNARIRATHSANKEFIELYWNIGKEIIERQEKFSWGKSVVEQLEKDIRQDFPNRSGFSAHNLWDMRRFYLEYKDYPNLRQVVAEIPWGHHLLILYKTKDILYKTKDIAEREYYLTAIIQCGWSRNILLNQINAKAYERQCLNNKQHNFAK